MSSDDSDYVVEEFIKPSKITARLINTDENDILGNFDDSCVKKKKNPKNMSDDDDDFGTDDDDDESDDTKKKFKRKKDYVDDEDSDEEEEIIHKQIEINSDAEEEDNHVQIESSSITIKESIISNSNNNDDHSVAKKQKLSDNNEFSISEAQLKKLQNGVSKSNRFVLYVTNLTAETTKEHLFDYFINCGDVKSIRIPKVRKSNYAFVEMTDENGFKNAFNLHNQIINGKPIKIQMSEAGKKKSANKKNIMKQKNRCLAEMRNESKTFLKSGKSFSHTNCGKKRMKERAILKNQNIQKK